ncbi:hypothetical protein ACLOJK_038653, partial [Asimina triloba]
LIRSSVSACTAAFVSVTGHPSSMPSAAPPDTSPIATIDQPLRTTPLPPSPATAATSSACHRLAAKMPTATTTLRPLPTLARLHHQSRSSIAIDTARPSLMSCVRHASTASIAVAGIRSSTSPVNRMPAATCIHVGTTVDVGHQRGTNTATPRRRSTSRALMSSHCYGSQHCYSAPINFL